MSIDRHNLRALVRAVAYDVKGSRLGRVAQVFLDDRTDEPAWVAVDVTRTRGMRLLPLAGAGLKGKYLVIRADRTTVRSAPRIDLGDGQLSSQDESRLLEHYGLLPLGGLLPNGADQAALYGEQRPATAWPDDTHRETAWQQPLQAESEETQVLSPSGDQTTGDRGAQSHEHNHEHSQPLAPMQQRDTAPSPTTAPGRPAPPATPLTTPEPQRTPTSPLRSPGSDSAPTQPAVAARPAPSPTPTAAQAEAGTGGTVPAAEPAPSPADQADPGSSAARA